MKKEIWILNGARTPFGDYNGVLRDFSEIELGAVAARGALERAEVGPARVEHVIFGNAMQNSRNAIYGARHVSLRPAYPWRRPA